MYTQQNRQIKVFTCLSDDTLLLRSFEGQETLSRTYIFDLTLVSFDGTISASNMIATPICVSITDLSGNERYFDGYIRRFMRSSSDKRGVTVYKAEMVPWSWFLTQMADCRIFQEKSTQEIIEEVVEKVAGSTGLICALEFRGTRRGKTPREYCVQYRESHYNFISRLLEEEGLFFFFEHDQGSHKMVVADSPTILPSCKHQDVGYYAPGVTRIPPKRDIITMLTESAEVRTDQIAQTDYNFETPHDDLMVSMSADQRGLERYDFPGIHLTVPIGEEIATVRLQENQSAVVRLQGSGNIRHLTPGHSMTLEGWPPTQGGSATSKLMVILSVRHKATQVIQPSGDSESGTDSFYQNSFSCLPASAPLRPNRTTPKPRIYGTQTAVVEGKEGEEIWTDQYGRIKVHFHWDREERNGEERSCWIRVAQTWAGRNWGAFVLPRIGQEVVVSFLEGDPDRPLVIGSVYNAYQMPPYALPANQTRSTFKSLSTKGGEGFNEIRLEDKKNAEQIFINAERNLDLNVVADAMHSIGGSAHYTIGGVDKDGNKVGDRRESIFKDSDSHIQGSSRELVDGKHSRTVGGDVFHDYQSNHQLKVKTETNIQSETVIIDASKGVTIKGPGGFILWDSAGITIVGNVVKINSGGTPLTSAITDKADAPVKPVASDTDQPGSVSNK